MGHDMRRWFGFALLFTAHYISLRCYVLALKQVIESWQLQQVNGITRDAHKSFSLGNDDEI